MLQKFLEYHNNNPKVYELFKRFTTEVREAGWMQYSARAVIHRIRWHTDITIRHSPLDDEKFKICNNHSPFYARMYMEEHPEYPEMFRLRQAVADWTGWRHGQPTPVPARLQGELNV